MWLQCLAAKNQQMYLKRNISFAKILLFDNIRLFKYAAARSTCSLDVCSWRETSRMRRQSRETLCRCLAKLWCAPVQTPCPCPAAPEPALLYIHTMRAASGPREVHEGPRRLHLLSKPVSVFTEMRAWGVGIPLVREREQKHESELQGKEVRWMFVGWEAREAACMKMC